MKVCSGPNSLEQCICIAIRHSRVSTHSTANCVDRRQLLTVLEMAGRTGSGRSIVVGVTGFKLMISMCSLIRCSCNLVEVLFEVL